MIGLGVSPENQRELQFLQGGEERRSPSRSALRPRGQVAAPSRSWVAKADRENGELARIVEGGAIDAQPITEAIPARVIERDAGDVDAATGSLARDEDLRLGLDLENRARTQRERGLTDPTRSHLREQLFQGNHSLHFILIVISPGLTVFNVDPSDRYSEVSACQA